VLLLKDHGFLLIDRHSNKESKSKKKAKSCPSNLYKQQNMSKRHFFNVNFTMSSCIVKEWVGVLHLVIPHEKLIMKFIWIQIHHTQKKVIFCI